MERKRKRKRKKIKRSSTQASLSPCCHSQSCNYCCCHHSIFYHCLQAAHGAADDSMSVDHRTERQPRQRPQLPAHPALQASHELHDGSALDWFFLAISRALPLAMSHSIISCFPSEAAHHSGVHFLSSSSVTSTRGSISSNRTTDTSPLSQPSEMEVRPFQSFVLTLRLGCAKSRLTISAWPR